MNETCRKVVFWVLHRHELYKIQCFTLFEKYWVYVVELKCSPWVSHKSSGLTGTSTQKMWLRPTVALSRSYMLCLSWCWQMMCCIPSWSLSEQTAIWTRCILSLPIGEYTIWPTKPCTSWQKHTWKVACCHLWSCWFSWYNYKPQFASNISYSVVGQNWSPNSWSSP